VAGIVGQLKRAHFKNLHVVQLMGGVGGFAYINPYNILQTACEKLHAQGTYFEAPAYASSVDAARSLGREIVQTSALPDLWRKCDLAVLGVGAAGRAALHVESGFIAAKEVDAIRAAGGVGDMLGRYFTREGRFLDLAVNKRAMAMPLDDLRRIPIVMTAGYGPEKLEALRGALRTGCLDVLVTDDATATALLSPRGKVGN
jgi:DNA-binding transcriptional regulator LsrR (DeoR family)